MGRLQMDTTLAVPGDGRRSAFEVLHGRRYPIHLLDVLEAAEYAGTPLTDTDIRERLFEVIDRGFIHEEAGYQVPFDLLDDCGGDEVQKARVREALTTFLKQARQYTATVGLNTPDQRETAFLESDVTSSSSATDVNEFFN